MGPEHEQRLAAHTGWDVVRPGGVTYPRLLGWIADPPELYVRGDLPVAPMLAIVGARRCSPYGEALAYDLAASLAASGCAIVSGLARGVDAAAHRGALEAGGVTVAVMGTGPD
ncbi:MAG: DNA-processing protein DprA, partial [Candidatus Dormibacteria bacterium]